MRFPPLLVLTTVLAAPLSARAAEPSQMRPGLWEVTVTMEMPGMPFKMPPTVTQQCVTPQEAQEKGVPPQGKDCAVTDMKRSGNRVTWKVACTGQTPGKGEGEVVFSGPDAYAGKMRLETGGMAMSTAYRARRLGDCR